MIVSGQECHVCHKAAYYWKVEPVNGEPVRAEMAYGHEKNDYRPSNGTPVICQWCKAKLRSDIFLNPSYKGSFDYETGEKERK